MCKYCACHEKLSQEELLQHLWRDMILANPKIWCSKMPLRKWAPWPSNMSDSCVSCTAPARWNASLQALVTCPTPAIVFDTVAKCQAHTSGSPFTTCRIHCACHTNDAWTSKSGPNMWCFCMFLPFWHILTWKRASRHKGAHFVNISAFSTSKNAPDLSFFKNSKCASRHNLVHFLKGSTSKSAPTMVCFWHPNLLRATAGCNFWSLIWRDGSAPAVLASLLLTLQGRKTLQNHSVSRLFYLFVRLDRLSSDSFSSLIFFTFSSIFFFFLFFSFFSFFFFLFLLFSSCFFFLLSSFFFLLSSFFFLLSSFFFLLSSFFFLLLLSSFLFSSLLLSSPLFSSLLLSSLLFSSLLWLFPPLLLHQSILSKIWLWNFLRQSIPEILKAWQAKRPSPSKIVKLLHF